jgi:hypothetical protein
MCHSPLHSEDLSQLFEVIDGCLSDWVDWVIEPGDTDWVQLIIEELLTQLLGEYWKLLNDWELDPPVLVLTQLCQSRDDGLREILNTQDSIQIL